MASTELTTPVETSAPATAPNVPPDVRRRAVLFTAVAGTILGLALWPLGFSSLWALVSIAAFLAGISDIGGG
ncbi:MAG TPA: hypothetical protein VE596_08480 [Gaiellaceae bacterium]|jgi:hypothetical protein|nr:hypothetical protein [Gaiellaceae bacterium]